MPSIAARATIKHNGERRRKRRAQGLDPDTGRGSPPASRVPYANIYIVGSPIPIKCEASEAGHNGTGWVSKASIPRGSYVSHLELVVDDETPVDARDVKEAFAPIKYMFGRVKGKTQWSPVYQYGGASSYYQPLPSFYERYGWWSRLYWIYTFYEFNTNRYYRSNHMAFRQKQVSRSAKKAIYRMWWHSLRMSYVNASNISLQKTDTGALLAQQRLGSRYNRSINVYTLGQRLVMHSDPANYSSRYGSQSPVEWSIRFPNFPKYYINFTCN